MCVYLQHVVRAATKEYPDAAEIKGCISIPRKSTLLENMITHN